MAQPHVQVRLYLINASVNLPAERQRAELVLARLVELLAYSVGLRGPRLRPRVRDVLKLKVQRVFVMLPVSAVFAAPVRKHTQKRDAARVEERDRLRC